MGKGEAEGEGEGTRREDRPIFINLTGSLARSALFHSFPWNKGRKEKSSNQKTELQDHAGTKYQARGRQSAREKFLREGI